MGKKQYGLFFLFVFAQLSWADDEEAPNPTAEAAREALLKQENDVDATSALEEVFQAAEKSFSLLKRGGSSLTYGFDYTYFADQRLNVVIENSIIRNFDVNPSAQHTFTNTFTYDYGLFNNLTLSVRVPLVTRFDTVDEASVIGVGDVSATVRWQPWSLKPGGLTRTLFATFSSTTGVSPFETSGDDLSTGSGFFSAGTGISVSKVIDPVVLFGTTTLTHNFAVSGLNQIRGGDLLEEVEPGDSLSLSLGFAYALSYDVSLSASFQSTFTTETTFGFRDIVDGELTTRSSVQTNAQVTGIMNFALGIRATPSSIINVNTGFGITEDSPDILLGLSMPVSFAGFKTPFFGSRDQ